MIHPLWASRWKGQAMYSFDEYDPEYKGGRWREVYDLLGECWLEALQ